VQRSRFAIFGFVFIAAALLGLPTAHASENVNTGLPGSTCAANDGGLVYEPPANGEFTRGLGVDAPAYYEIGRPSGSYVGQRPKGIMLVIHPGGWHLVGKGAVRYERPSADAWRARGWMTVSVDYRACARSWPDVLWFMRRVRQLAPDAVICAHGESAGGHLALLLASVRTDLACVIALGAPSDFGSLPDQTAFDPRTGSESSAGPTYLLNLATAAFGGDALVKASPRTYAGRIRARLLLASGETDPVISAAQNANLAAAVLSANPSAYVDVDLLPAGSSKFVHTGVDPAALADLDAREDALVAPLVD
jgi:acetyl esterase/lipase